MPTFDILETVERDLKRLDVQARAAFDVAVAKFVEDLTNIEEGTQTDFRSGLRVKPMRGRPDIMELTWDGNDGRATFSYGPEVIPGKRHVVWRRVGDHGIFGSP